MKSLRKEFSNIRDTASCYTAKRITTKLLRSKFCNVVLNFTVFCCLIRRYWIFSFKMKRLKGPEFNKQNTLIYLKFILLHSCYTMIFALMWIWFNNKREKSMKNKHRQWWKKKDYNTVNLLRRTRDKGKKFHFSLESGFLRKRNCMLFRLSAFFFFFFRFKQESVIGRLRFYMFYYI